MTVTYANYKKTRLGKAIDLDGYPPQQPFQCWDGANDYFLYIGGKIIHCGQTGYVKDIANMRNTNGILNFMYDVPLNEELQPGDVCIWTNCPNCPWSHIAMYDHDNGQSAVYFLGQNQPKPYMTIERIGVAGIIGVFRPKVFVAEGQDETVLKPTKDQILYVGSKVISEPFKLQSINYKKNLGYNRQIGGWFDLADVDEVAPVTDGKLDQIVHIGSMVQFKGGEPMTVTGLAYNNIITVDKLSYPVKADLFTEVE